MNLSSALLLVLSLTASAQTLKIKCTSTDRLEIHRPGLTSPLLVQNAPAGMRPYLHPLVAPDGVGVLTQFRPSDHIHQTGIFFGFAAVNGRSFFHHTDSTYFHGRGVKVEHSRGKRVSWSVVTDWLAEDGSVILTETQRWSMRDFGTNYVLDLDWRGRAAVDVTFGKFAYGGLFVRMPWKPGIQGEVTNSEGQHNAEAEGRRARWVDVGMEIEGRSDCAHIAVLDHPSNSGYPEPWRVDGNLGIAASRSRLGEWKITKGGMARARYRVVVYTGDINKDLTEKYWKTW